MSRQKSIVLDCDPGVDDLAALCMLASGSHQLAAVITSYGCASIRQTTSNARRFLDMLGRSDVPVIQGSSRPSIWPHPIDGARASTFFGRNGMNNVRLPVSEYPGRVDIPGDERFPHHIAELLRASDRVHYYLTGPCTNLARLCRRYPDLVRKKVASLTIMGGALGPGNCGTRDLATGVGVSEFNFYLDPIAADLVLSLDLEPCLVTWDEARKFKFLRSAAESSTGGSHASQFLLRMLRNFFKLYPQDTVPKNEMGGEPSVILSDPLVCFSEHDSGQIFDRRVKIVTHGDQFGQTVHDPEGHLVKYFELLKPASAMECLLTALGISVE